jgi:hypothetical protein
MKKIKITIAALALLAVNGFAQNSTENITQNNRTDFRDRLMFGLKGGVNYSNVYDSQGESFHSDAKFGLATGGFLAIPIGKYLGIQPEVLYSEKGFRGTGTILNSPYDVTRTTSYIDIPLFFALKPSEFITLLAGPQFSYLLKQKDVFANASTSIEQEKAFENANVRKNTLCFVGGADITLKHIVLGARVGWDIQNNNGDGTSTTPRYKNVWYQFTIGYRFYNL